MTPAQQAHERQIEATRQSLVAATDRPERHKLKAELYRLLSERDPAIVEELEAARMERVK